MADINGQLRTFTWRIENFSSIKDKKLFSENFYVGGNKWRLLIFPKGNGVDHLSIYLAVADLATLPYGWSRYARFRLTLVNQIDRITSTIKVTQHEFFAKKNACGFTSFLPLSVLHNPKRGYLVNDKCLVEVDISTDRTIGLKSHELIVEAASDKLKSKEADCGKAAIDNQKTLITKPEEISTPSPAILAAPTVLSSPGHDKAKSTNQNFSTKEADCGKAAIDYQKTLITKPEEFSTPSPAIIAAPTVLSTPGQDKAKSTNQNLPTKEADCGKAAIDYQKTLITKPEEISTPSPAILAAPTVLSSPGQDKAKSTNQNLPTAQSSSQSETIEPEDPIEEDMDTFFTSLESSQEAKEALAKIEEALNTAPANFYDSGKFSPLKKAFKILSNFDCSSTITVEQKTELLAMEENLKVLPDRVAKAVRDRNRLTEKESVKLTLTCNLERSLVKFKEAKAEREQIEQKIAALQEQVDEAEKNKESILTEQKENFRISKELKMELEALGKELPEYEAKAKVAEEEEKTVEVELGRMKDLISSIKKKI